MRVLVQEKRGRDSNGLSYEMLDVIEGDIQVEKRLSMLGFESHVFPLNAEATTNSYQVTDFADTWWVDSA